MKERFVNVFWPTESTCDFELFSMTKQPFIWKPHGRIITPFVMRLISDISGYLAK